VLFNTEINPFSFPPIRIIREAIAKSKDGRIDQNDFLNYAASSSRYSLFTPMEANIIFHFAGRGIAAQRLSLIDFAQLLDPRWRAPHEDLAETKAPHISWTQKFLMSGYGFIQGGKCRVHFPNSSI
jgi:solute carrier family 25 aspartate/glutamate transporter 12/13